MTQVVLAPNERAVGHFGVDARATFISKTYSHLLGGILLFALCCTVLFKTGVGASMVEWLGGGQYRWLMVLGAFMILGGLGSHMAASSRSKGGQYAGFGLYIAFQAIIFAPLLWIANTSYPGVITQAAVATVVGFSGLTAIAFVTRKDFSFLGGVVKWGMICAMLLIVGSIVFGFDLGLLFSVVMVALTGTAILWKTSDVIHNYPSDRYVGASLELFAYVALMFWYMIRVFMALRD